MAHGVVVVIVRSLYKKIKIFLCLSSYFIYKAKAFISPMQLFLNN